MQRLTRQTTFRRFALASLAAVIGYSAVAGTGAGISAQAAPPVIPAMDDATKAKAEAQIRKLGDDNFTTREAASDELIKLGLPIMPLLEVAVKDPDPEIRLRAQRLLDTVQVIDFERRLEAFAKDKNPTGDYRLPGWKRFQKSIGDSPSSRSLFVEILRAESGLIELAEAGPNDATKAMQVRIDQIQAGLQFGRQQQMSLGTMAGLMFVAGYEEVTVPDMVSQHLHNFTYQQDFRNAIEGGERKAAMRKLVGGWLVRTSGSNMAYQGLLLAMRIDLPEGLKLAEKMMEEKGPIQPHIKQYALLTLAKLGNEKHIPILEKAMSDTTVCGTFRNGKDNYQTQIRDIALACQLHLAKQELKNYGMTRAQPNAQMLFQVHTLGFDNDTKRKEAFDKWAAFRAKEGKSKEGEKGKDAEKPKDATKNTEVKKPDAAKPIELKPEAAKLPAKP